MAALLEKRNLTSAKMNNKKLQCHFLPGPPNSRKEAKAVQVSPDQIGDPSQHAGFCALRDNRQNCSGLSRHTKAHENQRDWAAVSRA